MKKTKTPAAIRRVESKLPAKPTRNGETASKDSDLRALIRLAKGKVK